jgi:hypothetical protein
VRPSFEQNLRQMQVRKRTLSPGHAARFQCLAKRLRGVVSGGAVIRSESFMRLTLKTCLHFRRLHGF